MSILLTRMQNLRATGNLDKNEFRGSTEGMYDLFLNETSNPNGILTSDLKAKAMGSMGRTLEVPVIDYTAPTITKGGTRSITIADAENTSRMLSLTFQRYSFGFTQVPSAFTNNEIGAQEDFNKKMLARLLALRKELDKDSIAAVAAKKTQIFNENLGYDTTGNVVTVPYTGKDDIIGDLNVLMEANDYLGKIHIVGNGGVKKIINKLEQQGVYNSTNKQLEYLDKALHYSYNIANAGTDAATMYAIEEGNVGILTRVDRDSLAGIVSGTGHVFDMVSLPIVDLTVGTLEYDSVGDFNAIAGAATADLTASYKKHYSFDVEVAFVTAYNSDSTTKADPFIKVAITKPVVNP
jgi:hypothetical protein